METKDFLKLLQKGDEGPRKQRKVSFAEGLGSVQMLHKPRAIAPPVAAQVVASKPIFALCW